MKQVNIYLKTLKNTTYVPLKLVPFHRTHENGFWIRALGDEALEFTTT